MGNLQRILADLIRIPSVTPMDAGCQDYMMSFLRQLGFTCEVLNKPPVSNFFAHYGTNGPMLVFAGHTDVVPIGNREKWESDPFVLTERNGLLYGRGVADMKGSLAAMLVMAQRFIGANPDFHGRLGFLITSGEEGEDYHYGTPYVMKHLYDQGLVIDYCIVGEPSSTHEVGDVIKIGRRGSLNANISLLGKQGHVAYPHLAENPIHSISPALAELTGYAWDQGNAYFPPTSMQITYLNSGGHANNIIPGELHLHLNFRYSTEHNQHSLREIVESVFKKHEVSPSINWQLSGEPFLTDKGTLVSVAKEAILEQAGLKTELSTSGGTSDGRFIAPYGVDVIEIGPQNASIHQVNECLALKDLEVLERIYYSITEKLL